MAAKPTKAKPREDSPDVEALRPYAEGQPVDALAVERYRSGADVAACLRLCRSRDSKEQVTGRLRAAAIVAAQG